MILQKRKIIKTITVLMLMSMLSWATNEDLSIQVVPLMPSTITNVQLAHYDIEATGKGPTMFNLILSNMGDEDIKGLGVVYTIYVNSAVLDGGKQIVYKGLSNQFELKSKQTITVISNDFLQEFGSGLVHQEKRIQKLEDKGLENQVLDAGKIPSGKMEIALDLVTITGGTNHTVITYGNPIVVDIINVSQLNLVAPGISAEDLSTVLEITNPNPRFTWLSDLTSGIYNNIDSKFGNSIRDIFEIAIYEKKPGQNSNEVLASVPIIKTTTQVPYLDFPATGKQLVKGNTYIWQVKGLLRGIKDAYIISEPYAFKYANTKDPEVTQKTQALTSILSLGDNGDGISAIIADYGDEVEIKSEGKTITIQDLSELSNKFMSGEYKIISTDVQ